MGFKVYGNEMVLKKPCVITMGNFDGVHLGHQYLINSMHKEDEFYKKIAITFFPHPNQFFMQKEPFKLLCSLEDRVEMLLKHGLDAVVVQDFNSDFANKNHIQFLNQWLFYYFNPKIIYIGHDFHYGKMREGNYTSLLNYCESKNVSVNQINPLVINSHIVSSSLIKKFLKQGNIKIVNKLLGYNYYLKGIVVHGNGQGKILGFPTANLGGFEQFFMPCTGVYACLVHLNCFAHGEQKKLPGILNCGYRPTINNNKKLNIEAHILNFNKNIYDQKIKFEFEHYVRTEKTFGSLTELKNQIEKDVFLVTKYFSYDMSSSRA